MNADCGLSITARRWGCAVSTLAKAVTPLQTLRPMATDHLEESPCVC
jgi:hypothetical protein